MISNLPLLFANGYPTSLDKMTQPQLERFIPFMVQCSWGHDTAQEIVTPQWWPKELPFSNPCITPSKPDKVKRLEGDFQYSARSISKNCVNVIQAWCKTLKKLVTSCYTYHQSAFLIDFCAELSQHPPSRLRYVDNWDSTTSLHHKGTGKLLVTFRNENMMYDRKPPESPRKCLLPRVTSSVNLCNVENNIPQMVQAELVDIYLCDGCDAEMDSLTAVKEHEKVCGLEKNQSNSRPSSPEILDVDQALFLRYFGLHSESSMNDLTIFPSSSTSTISHTPPRTRSHRSHLPLNRCPTIPFSSPAGKVLLKRVKATVNDSVHLERLERMERYCNVPRQSQSKPHWMDKDNKVYPTSYKKPKQEWAHSYNFGFSKLKMTLDVRSQIQLKLCKPVSVRLKQLTQMDIEMLLRYSRVAEANSKKTVFKPKTIYYKNPFSAKISVALTRMTTKHVGDVDVHVADVIDLCTSDEDDNENRISDTSHDENKDPKNSMPISASLESSTKGKTKERLRRGNKRCNEDLIVSTTVVDSSRGNKSPRTIANTPSLSIPQMHALAFNLSPCLIGPPMPLPSLERFTRSNELMKRGLDPRTVTLTSMGSNSPLGLPSLSCFNNKYRSLSSPRN